MVRSWQIKLARAEHHLRDLKRRLAPLEGEHVYAVSEVFEANNDFGRKPYVFRLSLPEIADPILPVIAGELMFNLRSALDHLAVAMVPPDLRSKNTAFPIFTDDIDEPHPSGDGYLHPEARKAWKRMIHGLPEDAISIIKFMQPYNLRRDGRDPEHVSLARLSAYQNADKHNHLVVVVSGVSGLSLSFVGPDGRREAIDHPGVPGGYFVGDGARLGAIEAPLHSHVKVEAKGTLSVHIGDGLSGDYLPCLEALEGMITDAGGAVEMLERYACHLPPPPERAYTEDDHM